jgi:thiol-disulfide isomerase/thioredoxin
MVTMDVNANVGSQAEPFALTNLNSGELHALSDYKGKVVYLDFWASWCKPCVKSFPVLNEFYHKYKDKGFEVVAINLDEDKNKAVSFLKKIPVEFTVLYDKNAQIAETYQVQAMPSSYFIDKKGVIRLVSRGYFPSDKTKIEKAINLLIKQ